MISSETAKRIKKQRNAREKMWECCGWVALSRVLVSIQCNCQSQTSTIASASHKILGGRPIQRLTGGVGWGPAAHPDPPHPHSFHTTCVQVTLGEPVAGLCGELYHDEADATIEAWDNNKHAKKDAEAEEALWYSRVYVGPLLTEP